MLRLHPHNRLLSGDEPFARHIDRGLHRRAGGPFPGPCLEDPEAASFDGELDVLQVPIVRFEARREQHEFSVELREFLPQLGDFHRRAEARDDVLALRVREEFAEQLSFPGGRVPRERDPGPGVGANVAEGHRLHRRGRTEVVGDLVEIAVVHRTLAVPGSEDRADRLAELDARVVRKRLPSLAAIEALELLDDGAECVGVQVRVGLAPRRFLESLEDRLELAPVDLAYDPTVHPDEPPIRVPGEPIVRRQAAQRRDGRVVEAEVQDRVHHARHGELRAGSDGDGSAPSTSYSCPMRFRTCRHGSGKCGSASMNFRRTCAQQCTRANDGPARLRAS